MAPHRTAARACPSADRGHRRRRRPPIGAADPDRAARAARVRHVGAAWGRDGHRARLRRRAGAVLRGRRSGPAVPRPRRALQQAGHRRPAPAAAGAAVRPVLRVAPAPRARLDARRAGPGLRARRPGGQPRADPVGARRHRARCPVGRGADPQSAACSACSSRSSRSCCWRAAGWVAATARASSAGITASTRYSGETHVALRALPLTKAQGAEEWELRRRDAQLHDLADAGTSLVWAQAAYTADRGRRRGRRGHRRPDGRWRRGRPRCR